MLIERTDPFYWQNAVPVERFEIEDWIRDASEFAVKALRELREKDVQKSYFTSTVSSGDTVVIAMATYHDYEKCYKVDIRVCTPRESFTAKWED